MAKYSHFYLVKIQYLGFRYHGWAIQDGVKTIEGMLRKTMPFVLPDISCKILGASRTDAMVSATDAAFELFAREELDCKTILDGLNHHFPPDVRAMSVVEVDAKFNIIQDSKIKEYIYLFTHGDKMHPYAAPFMTYVPGNLDIELMKQGAKLFEGTHNFFEYAYHPSETTKFEREMVLAEIVPNDVYTANFFPAESYVFRVKAPGFLRYQVRMMMGRLFELGKPKGNEDLETIAESLSDPKKAWHLIAPRSGLMLAELNFD